MCSAPSQARCLALLGAGNWGMNLARCFEQLGALALVVDPQNDGALAELSARSPGLRTSRELATALSDPRISAIAIATPASSHFELASAALRAGKDVLVEKPLCLNVTQARALVELAGNVDRTLMVGHLLQYHPCLVKLRELVAEGALGRLLTLNSTRLNLGRFRSNENVLWSFAPHDISVILSLCGEKLPLWVRSTGSASLHAGVVDSTLTMMRFETGISAQIHVSWLNPFKEQRLTVVGTRSMAVFDDSKPWSSKLTLYRDYLDARLPRSAPTALGEPVAVEEAEPLLCECAHFLEACRNRTRPHTDGQEGLRVVSVLDMAERSLARDGEKVSAPEPQPGGSEPGYFAHPSAVVAADAAIGAGTKIWHFTQIMSGARVGAGCSLGQNVNVAGGAVLGNGVKVQNNVSIYDGVEIEDDVFLGPSCVLTNVKNPRAELNRQGQYQKTRILRGCSVGANATIVCGVTLGRYSFIAAGAVVVADVPDYALVMGNPARQTGWMSRHGQRLPDADADGLMVCPESGLRYREGTPGQCKCLDLDETASLPGRLS